MKKNKTQQGNTESTGAKPAKVKPVVTLKSFADLGAAVEQLKLSVPEWDTLSLDGLGDTVAGKLEAAKTIRGGVADALKFVTSAKRQLNACTTHDERRFVTEELAEHQTKAQAYFGQVLSLKGAMGAVAAVAYLTTSLTADYKSAEDVNAMLADLVEKGLLTTAGSGSPITIGYQHYQLGNFGMDSTDIAEISKIVDGFSRVVKNLEHQRREALNKQMSAQADVSLEDALAGKLGTCLVHMPPEERTDGSGKKRWYGGGEILWDFQRDYVVPIKASGSCERLIADIVARGAKLTRFSLTWEAMPGWNSMVNSIGKSLNLNRREAEFCARDVSTLWHMMRRGINDHEEMKAQKKTRAEMAARAKITSLQFFGLNGTAGGKPVEGELALLQFDGIVRRRNGEKISNPFFLATRSTEGNRELFQVVEVPQHLQEVFGGSVGKKFPFNDCRECPDLGDVLDKIRNQQEMVATTAAKQ